MKEIKKRRVISIPEVKGILEKVGITNMDQIQRWTFDYASKFSKISNAESAQKIKNELITKCKLTDDEATELINIKPTTLAELRSFTFGWKKLILAETLEKILMILAH